MRGGQVGEVAELFSPPLPQPDIGQARLANGAESRPGVLAWATLLLGLGFRGACCCIFVFNVFFCRSALPVGCVGSVNDE